MARIPLCALMGLIVTTTAEARVVRLRIERREALLEGRSFGLAVPYEKLVGQVDFSLDPTSAANAMVVDLALAPRNESGEVEFHADFNIGSITESALRLARMRYLLVEDLPEVVSRARAHFQWATRAE